jgi:hypothetical protein
VRVFAALLALAIWQQQLPPRDTRPPAAAATGRIAGVITTDEAQPRPLRRARVTLNGDAITTGWSVIAADDGTFSFDRLPPGRYLVSALKDGYVTMSHGAARPGRRGTLVQVTERQTTTLTLRLPRGGVITGTVLDVDGQPAEEVVVSALARRFNGFGFLSDVQYVNAGTPALAMTNDRGVYRIYGLIAGDYLIAAKPPAAVLVAPGLSGTLVRMMSRGRAIDKRMLLTSVFHPGATDVARAERVTVRAGQERAGIDVQLEYVPVAVVRGTVPATPGFNPARVTLWRTDELTTPQTGPVATADSQGRFQFPSVAPGPYRVTARSTLAGAPSGGRGGSAGGDVQFATADVAVNGEDVDVTLALRPALSIAGTIVLDGAPPAIDPLLSQLHVDMPAFVTGASGGWPLPPATLDGRGFRLDGIVPGLYRLSPNAKGLRTPLGNWWLTSIASGGRELLDAPLDIEQTIADAVVTLADRASGLSGTVRDAQGAAAPDAWIVVFPVNRSFWFSGSRRITGMKPTPQGQWTIRNLPPGDYRIIATLDMEQGEWFDPAVLDRLSPVGASLKIAGTEQQTIDLVIR